MSSIVGRSIPDTMVPVRVIQNYENLSLNFVPKKWHLKKEENLWHELCFCILSANVNYDLVRSVFSHLKKKKLLQINWLITQRNSKKILENEFNSAIFKPLKKDGTYRKYRYPKRRSSQVVNAAKIIYKNNGSIKKILRKAKNDLEAREFFMSNIPGLGIKEASHFLRNIGYSESLAILDVHMLWFLEKNSLIKIKNTKHLTKKLYLSIEKILRNFAKFHKFILSILDAAIWHYMRNRII